MTKEEARELKETRSNDWREYDEENSILFNSYCKDDRMVLSNMYPCIMEYNGMVFNSVDQMYHWLMFDGGGEEARKIRDKIGNDMVFGGVMSGFSAKKLSEKNEALIPEVNKKNHLKILKMCHIVKAKCCKEFRKKLIESGSKNLVEWSFWGDYEYGVNQLERGGKNEGINSCGRVMMEVRRMLLAGELGDYMNE